MNRDFNFSRAISNKQHERFKRGDFSGEHDLHDFRRFVHMTQDEFAAALGISVHTLRNWEQGHRKPNGAALSLLREAARSPRRLRKALAHA